MGAVGVWSSETDGQPSSKGQMKNTFFKPLVFPSRVGVALGKEGKSSAEGEKELLLKQNHKGIQKANFTESLHMFAFPA